MQVPFGLNGTTSSIDATATAQSTTLTQTANSVRIVNEGPNTAFVLLGASDVVATVTAMPNPIPAGVVELFSKGRETHVSAICASGETAKLYFTCGEGI